MSSSGFEEEVNSIRKMLNSENFNKTKFSSFNGFWCPYNTSIEGYFCPYRDGCCFKYNGTPHCKFSK